MALLPACGIGHRSSGSRGIPGILSVDQPSITGGPPRGRFVLLALDPARQWPAEPSLEDEEVARDPPHRLEPTLVPNAPGRQLPVHRAGALPGPGIVAIVQGADRAIAVTPGCLGIRRPLAVRNGHAREPARPGTNSKATGLTTGIAGGATPSAGVDRTWPGDERARRSGLAEQPPEPWGSRPPAPRSRGKPAGDGADPPRRAVRRQAPRACRSAPRSPGLAPPPGKAHTIRVMSTGSSDPHGLPDPAAASDIRPGWIDRFAPRPARPYLTLMRLDRPIGTWLLLFPCWWGMALAPSAGMAPAEILRLALLFAVGAVVMRGAGCVINDLFDRDIDLRVARTRTRPIASGAVDVRSAVVFLAFLLTAGLLVLVQFNATTILLGAASLLLVVPYPLMKRITWWPQAFLGLTFNWGALVGWTAVTGALAPPAVALYAAGVFWTLAYDTIYAHQDKADDALIGVKSTARRLGTASKLWITGFYTAMGVLLVAAGSLAGLHVAFLLGVGAGLGLAASHVRSWDPDDPASCLARFKAQKWIALLILSGLALGRAAA